MWLVAGNRYLQRDRLGKFGVLAEVVRLGWGGEIVWNVWKKDRMKKVGGKNLKNGAC